MVATARLLVPLLFLLEGLAHHSFLLDLSGTHPKTPVQFPSWFMTSQLIHHVLS